MIRFAPGFEHPAGSPIRELYGYLGRPGMISFAGGYPSPALFDAQGLAEAAATVFGGDAAALQYGPTDGDPSLKDELLRLGRARGIDGVGREELLVTTGSQQAFDLLIRVLVRPGDTVALESPAYPAAIQALRLAGARLLEIPMDGLGLDTHALAGMLASAPAHARPRLLYTVPNFSNPRGTLLPEQRRAELLELAHRYDLLVVEDDPYGELGFDAGPARTLYARGREEFGSDNPVIYLSSLSKIVAPALRIGWLIAPGEILRRCAIAKQTVDLCTPPLTQQIAARYLRLGRHPRFIAAARAEYARRATAMADDLETELHDMIRFERPRGGMFIWVELATAVDPRALFDAAVQQRVLFVPGAAFHCAAPSATCMRLSFATADTQAIHEGVLRLARACRGLYTSTARPS